MKPWSNAYNRHNHGFQGLVTPQRMENWYFWAKKLLVEKKGMPEAFAEHVALLVKHFSFQVPPDSQTAPHNFKEKQARQEANDIRPSKRNSHLIR